MYPSAQRLKACGKCTRVVPTECSDGRPLDSEGPCRCDNNIGELAAVQIFSRSPLGTSWRTSNQDDPIHVRRFEVNS